MRTKLLLLFLLANFSIYAQYTSIPDINFESKLIALGIDSGVADGKVLKTSIATVTDLDVSYLSISSLSGIQDFVNLKTLKCTNNNIISLSIYNLTQLKSLDCNNNKIASLFLINNSLLEYLDCSYNQLNSLSVTSNLKLTSLNCAKNKLSILDVTFNSILNTLLFDNNYISDIDLSHNPLLDILACRDNLLMSLDISKNLSVSLLAASNNQLTSLNLSKHPLLYYVDCSHNKLMTLNIKNGKNTSLATGFDATNNPNLTCILVDDVSYANTKWSTNKDAAATFNATTCGPAHTAIPDSNFENALITLGIDSGTVDGKVLTSNLANITALNVASKNISDLTGIQDFTSLKTLDCSNNQLTDLKFFKNIKLEEVRCQNNKLTNLDVTKNTLLAKLYCSKNQLKEVNVSKNYLLEQLYCPENQLEYLYLNLNLNLKVLECNSNLLTRLDVTDNTLLINLSCYTNQLTVLNITQNNLLTTLNCDSNQLITLDVSQNKSLITLSCKNNQITNLDISKNNLITALECQNNNLFILNLKNSNNSKIVTANSNFTNNPNLTCIQVDNISYSATNWNNLKDPNASFSVSACPELTYTLIPDINFENKLIALGIDSGVSDGKVLNATINKISSLNIENAYIVNLTGIEGFTNLKSLICNDNELTSLDVSKNAYLEYFECAYNPLTALDVSKNKLLDDLYVGDTKITSLDVTQNPELISIYCHDNQLTALDVSKNPKLIILYCLGNKIEDLDVSANPMLSTLNCSNNNLSSLNIKNGNNAILRGNVSFKNNPNLTCIQVDNAVYSTTNWTAKKDATAAYSNDCSESNTYTAITDKNFEQKLIDLGIDTDGLNGKISIANINSITTLDLSNSNIIDITGIKDFKALTYLNISNNKITSLDVSNNELLETLDASSNQLTTIDLSNNTKLTIVYVANNPLTSLNLKNGNNKNFILPSQTGKQSASGLYTSFLGLTTLGCIQVDDAAYSNANWSNIKESTTTYSNTCKTLGVDDAVFTKATIYPNPTTGEVNINNITLEKATVYNTLGQLVKSFTLNSANTSNTINLSGLPKGIYYIYLINQDAASAKKIIVE